MKVGMNVRVHLPCGSFDLGHQASQATSLRNCELRCRTEWSGREFFMFFSAFLVNLNWPQVPLGMWGKKSMQSFVLSDIFITSIKRKSDSLRTKLVPREALRVPSVTLTQRSRWEHQPPKLTHGFNLSGVFPGVIGINNVPFLIMKYFKSLVHSFKVYRKLLNLAGKK